VTQKQYILFQFIRNRVVHHGKAPTFSEMKEYMKVTSNQTIGDWLAILERDGYLSKNKGKLRGISVTNKGLTGFDENLLLQKPEAIKTSFTPFSSNASTNPAVFNSPTSFDKGININADGVIPTWEGGEKNGSS
jgi:SOS-response transcriptional repressor LexA